jgi:diaminobutyrate-2-oxoglutarate transaminase
MSIIERRESSVRSYCRSFPETFDRAEGAALFDVEGRRYLDFFAGAGALNYGHNPPQLRRALLDYIESGSVSHSLDLTTAAKCRLLETFERHILEPRGMDHRVLFPGPTGTNAVEAALKLARKATGRTEVVAFTNGFHGMTLGSLAATGNAGKRAGAGVPLNNILRVPFEGYRGEDGPELALADLARFLEDRSSGFDRPAAVLLETVQAEGGVRPASDGFLRGLRALTKRQGVLMIVDDIQVGCGRTGGFFSFESADIEPDLICLSKSLSGYGLPLSMVLVRPQYDVFEPGEHNGTFRGHNLAFVTAREAIRTWWTDDALSEAVAEKAAVVEARLDRMGAQFGARRRGRGLIQGLVFEDAGVAPRASAAAFDRGLIIETAGAEDDHLVYPGHNQFVTSIAAHRPFRDGLTPERRAVLDGVVSQLQSEIFDIQRRYNAARREKMLARKPELKELRLDPAARAPFREAARPTWARFVESAGRRGQSALDALRAAVDAEARPAP